MGLDEGGVGDEREQRAGVGEGEEAVPDGCRFAVAAGFVLREPELEERAGGGEQKEGQADGAGEGPEDSEDGMSRRR